MKNEKIIDSVSYDEMLLLTGDFYFIWLRNASEDGLDCSEHWDNAIYKIRSGACLMCGRPVTNSGYPADWGSSCQCKVRNKCMELHECHEKAKEHRKLACQYRDKEEFIIADQYDKRAREISWDIDKDPEWNVKVANG
jgi:ferredoxin